MKARSAFLLLFLSFICQFGHAQGSIASNHEALAQKALESEAKVTCPEWKLFYRQLAVYSRCLARQASGSNEDCKDQPPAPKTPCLVASSGGSGNNNAYKEEGTEKKRQDDLATQRMQSATQQFLQNSNELIMADFEMDMGGVNNALSNVENMNIDLNSRLGKPTNQRPAQAAGQNVAADWNATPERTQPKSQPERTQTEVSPSGYVPAIKLEPVTLHQPNELQNGTDPSLPGLPAVKPSQSQLKGGSETPEDTIVGQSQKKSVWEGDRGSVAVDAKPVATRPARQTKRPDEASADQLRAFQYYRWAEQLADGRQFPLTSQLQTEQPLTYAQQVSDRYLTQTEKLIGGPTPRTQFLRTALYAQQLTVDVSGLSASQTGTDQQLMKLQQLTDTTENHLNRYLQLAHPIDSRYTDALKLQNQLHLQQADYGTLSKFLVDKQKYEEEIKQLREQAEYYRNREAKAKKGRGGLLITGLLVGGISAIVLDQDIRFYNSYRYDGFNNDISRAALATAVGGLLLTTAIAKYFRRGKFRRLGRETEKQFNQLLPNRPVLKIEPKINLQLQFAGNGLVVKF